MAGVERGVHPVSTPSTEVGQAPEADQGSGRRRRRALIALALVVVVLGVVVGWLWWQDQRAQEAEASREAAVQVARERAVAILSYDYNTVDQDLQRARSGLTGRFLDEFNRGALVVAPTARTRQISTHARVIRAAVVDARPDDVVVLLFVNQNSRSVQSPDVQLTNTRVQLTMTKKDDQWLVSEFKWV